MRGAVRLGLGVQLSRGSLGVVIYRCGFCYVLVLLLRSSAHVIPLALFL